MKILFITSNRVGDAVLSMGTLSWLVERYPDARFTIACGPYAAGLFRAVPRLDRLIVLEKKTWNRHWLELWRICCGTRWDLIVDLRDSIVSRLLRSGKRVSPPHNTGKHKVVENGMMLPRLENLISGKERKNSSPLVGEVRRGGVPQEQSSEGEALAQPRSPHPNPPHKGEGILPVTASPPSPHLWLDNKAEIEAAKILPATRPLLALAPAANWPCKQWPIERFAELAQALVAYPPLLSAEALAKADGEGRNLFADPSRQTNFGEGSKAPLANASVLVIADAHEREQVAPLLQSIPAERRVEVIGRDLLTVAACLKQCQLFVGNDSGLMHVAATMGTPTLGLFGPGYENIYGPWGPHCAVIRTPEPREELLARLPDLSAREPNLMEGLSVEKVHEAARALIAPNN